MASQGSLPGTEDGVPPTVREIFRRGSRTYFNSTRFFSPSVRDDVSVLYGFVRKADDYVDATPQDAAGFHAFRDRYERASRGTRTGDPVVDAFAELARRRTFRPSWIAAFFRSMEDDLGSRAYRTRKETDAYIYGSAEVVGLMMARILDLPEGAEPHARRLGAAMQYINFIRDIAEDVALARSYFPEADLRRFGLASLAEEDARARPEAFRRFVRAQIDRYLTVQSRAEEGFSYIGLRDLPPIRTAAAMYRWTALRIRDDPFVVFREKVKPSKARILATGIRYTLGARARALLRRAMGLGRRIVRFGEVPEAGQ